MMKRRKTGEQLQSQESSNIVEKVLEMIDQLTLAERSDVVSAIQRKQCKDFTKFLPTELSLSILKYLNARDIIVLYSMIQAPENVVVTCIQFAGYCNEYIVTGSEMPPIVVYAVDPQTQEWRVSHSLIGHEGGVWAMEVASNPNADTAVLSPHLKDKNTLVSGSTDKTVRVWDIQRAQCLYVLQAHSSTVRCLSVCTVDNQLMILSGSRDKSVRAWKVDFAPPPPHRGGGDSSTLTKSQSPAQSLQQSQEPQSSYVQMDMSQGVKKPVVIQESYYKLDGHTDSVRAIACKYPYSATGSYDATVRLWDLNDGRCIHVLTGHTNKVYSVVIHLHKSTNSDAQSFHRNGVVISGSLDCTMRVWDIMSGCCVRVIADHASLVGLLQLEELTYIPASFRSPLQRRLEPAPSQHLSSRPLNAPRSLLNQSSQLVTPVEKNVQSESLSGVQKILTSSQQYTTMKSTYPILISAAADSTMKIWHPSCILDYEVDKLHYDRPCISTLSGHPTAITCFQFDSDKIVSGSEGRISVYDTRNAMFVRDLSIGVANSWRVCLDWNKAVCAVDRDETTWIEIYDFSSTGI
ncbi:hypothetical protein MP228_009866 [Amoeboaphelidium protococcarum]|nr:hypothetical protein MP228_009866 [Amoeboaphelidium protococcarum]